MTTYPYLYTIYSNNRTSGTSSNFHLNLPLAIQKVTKIKLLSLNLFNSWYNLINGLNNQIDFNDGVSNLTLSISPDGAYNINDLLNLISSGMTALSVGHGNLTFGASFNQDTMKTTLSANGNFSLLWNSGTNNLINCRNLLGFIKLDLSGAMSYISQGTINLVFTQNLFISCNQLKIPNQTTNTNQINTFIIPVNVNSGSQINYLDNQFFNQVINYNPPTIIYSLDINLLSDNNQILNINSQEWNMTLQFYFD